MSESDLHGSAPDDAPVVLLLVDVINDLEFEGGEDLLPYAVEAARHIRELKERAVRAGIPVIYANDNFGRWRSDFRQVVEHSLRDGVRGKELAKLLAPTKEDYFVLKPKHSAFFATTLDTLLEYLGAQRLVLAGYSADNCVMITAIDAYMRDFQLFVPSDCVASASTEHKEQALEYMRRVLKVDTRESGELDLGALLSK
jgi:nicotinamidase-related amidase